MRAAEIAKELQEMIDARKAYANREQMPFEQDVDIESKNGHVYMNIWGGGIVLTEGGHWYFNDTSGG